MLFLLSSATCGFVQPLESRRDACHVRLDTEFPLRDVRGGKSVMGSEVLPQLRAQDVQAGMIPCWD